MSTGGADSSTVYPSETQSQTQTVSADKSSSEHKSCVKQDTVSAVTEDNVTCKCNGRISSMANPDGETSEDVNCSCMRKADHDLSCSNEVQTEDESSSLTEECNLCVVCQNALVFYTLLLCRHACVCYSCIKLLDRCPMCRGFIDSYFRLGDAPDPELRETSGDVSPGPRLSWWESLNNRFNHILGFD